MINSNGFSHGIKKFGSDSQPLNPFVLKPLVKNPYVDGPDLYPDVFKPTQPVRIEPEWNKPFQTPVEIPDWSKMPLEVPNSPSVPSWTQIPKELPNPTHTPVEVPYNFPGLGQEHPGELPGSSPHQPGQFWLLS